ncbi:glycosyltransferase [Flavobacterium akiainvivens]|nr:glycosyltransferase [Flavobacterium akiainvivens]SFQ62157.1 N-acetylgalactosamine-N,N'-diacetylbacillosaminyl-diphospho-undecaprenol 4-alpha-N-acetylgalactosaminyltransferase [Flavobacterium akiainvivens]
MLQAKQTKLLLVGDSLAIGGAEKVHAVLSGYFAAQGIEVHNAVIEDMVAYNYSGALLNLGLLKKKHNGLMLKIKRVAQLRSYIKKHRFDYIIDFRMHYRPWQELIMARFVFTVPTVYTVHSYVTHWYLPEKKWLARLTYNTTYGVVAICNKIEETIKKRHGLTNSTTIYNPVDLKYIDAKLAEPHTPLPYKYIMGAGRMDVDNVKQFDKLIAAYAESILPMSDVKLVLLGDGELKEKLQEQAKQQRVADKVVFAGFKENPYPYMRDALFFVLSSRNEGLPMVLIEALACGTPVVSFNCLTGPSEIVEHEENGLLVEGQDYMDLCEAMGHMYVEPELYSHCKANARPSVQKFDINAIGRQWLDYLNIN